VEINTKIFKIETDSEVSESAYNKCTYTWERLENGLKDNNTHLPNARKIIIAKSDYEKKSV